MEYVLQTDNLTKCYKNIPALDGLTMHIPKGAIYGFVGRNGAGKTTLIRLICGLQEPSSGSFSLFGIRNDSKDIVNSRRKIGAIVETPAIYMDMTAEENLRQQYRILGISSYVSIPEILKLVGLENTGKKKVRQFSLGMKQRLGIAIALSGDPRLLILDEPTNGLDPQGIVEMREMATHYGIIDHGQMVKELSAQELNAACRKCVRVEVSDTSVLARVLDAMGVEYQIISDTTADVFASVNVTQLTLALAKEKCEVLSMQERDESLENYFLSLTGGGDQ